MGTENKCDEGSDLAKLYELMEEISILLKQNNIVHEVFLSIMPESESPLFIVLRVNRHDREKIRLISDKLRTVFYNSIDSGVSLLIEYG
ncbi:MAG: hypothetical protein DRN04_12315 [Thermoprotei archaeon]|nr:MAG: hypothetical protein DRN04_12315 [Thermoprotei archaeon]